MQYTCSEVKSYTFLLDRLCVDTTETTSYIVMYANNIATSLNSSSSVDEN